MPTSATPAAGPATTRSTPPTLWLKGGASPGRKDEGGQAKGDGMNLKPQICDLRVRPFAFLLDLMRPLPNIPRGPRRATRSSASSLLLACPRLSPEWELSALRALIKPQLGSRIRHRNG